MADFGLVQRMGGVHGVKTSNIVIRCIMCLSYFMEHAIIQQQLKCGLFAIFFAIFLQSSCCIQLITSVKVMLTSQIITFQALDTLDKTFWPGITSLPDYASTKIYIQSSCQESHNIFITATEDFLELMEERSVLNPAQCIDTMKALMAVYFIISLRTTKPEMLQTKKIITRVLLKISKRLRFERIWSKILVTSV